MHSFTQTKELNTLNKKKKHLKFCFIHVFNLVDLNVLKAYHYKYHYGQHSTD